MINNVKISNLLFIDIETVPRNEQYFFVPEIEKNLWDEKKGKNKPENIAVEDYYFENAGIFAEFGKIICISVAQIMDNKFVAQSFYGDDEKELLHNFLAFINKQPEYILLCGHNIREFDVPYICRRTLINEIKLPNYFKNLQTKKPWEVGLIDTMDLWKFGDYKNPISLKLLAYCLNIPSPKDDIDGKMVGKTYWIEKNLERIKIYCEKDVLTVAQIVLKLKEMPLL